MSKKESLGKPIDSIRLSDEQWRVLSGQFKRESSGENHKDERRRHERVPYQSMLKMAIAVEMSNGSRCIFVVRSDDLSNSGIGFYHGSYLHIDTRVVFLLRHLKGDVHCIEGKVRRCVHVRDHIHKVGVEFGKLIEVSDYVFRPDDESVRANVRDAG